MYKMSRYNLIMIMYTYDRVMKHLQNIQTRFDHPLTRNGQVEKNVTRLFFNGRN